MALMDLNSESLTKRMGQEVPEIYVLIAKHSVMDMDASTIAEVLGVSVVEVQEVEADRLYQDIRLVLAAENARALSDTDASWDKLEEVALSNLMERMKFERDTDFLLKVAAMSNRAQRRVSPTKNKILDPSSGAAKVGLQLSARIIERLQSAGQNGQTVDRMIEARVSVVHGTHVNPSFDEIDTVLGVSKSKNPTQPVYRAEDGLPRTIEHPSKEPTYEDFEAERKKKRVYDHDVQTLAQRLLGAKK